MNTDILATITTRAENGKHFTEIYSDSDLAELEAAGLIEITRPVHQTGIPYSCKYWSVELTEEGREFAENYLP